MTPAEIGPSAGGESPRDEAPAERGAFDDSLFRQILETVPFGLFVLDAGGTPAYANTRATTILRKGVAEEIGVADLAQAYSAFVAGTDQAYPLDRMPIVRALAGEITSVSDMEIRHADGSATFLEVSGAPVFDGGGKVKYAVAVFHDVTATRTLEQTLRRLAGELEEQAKERAEQLRALQSAAEASHGMRPSGSHAHVPDDEELIEPCGRCIVFKEAEQLRDSSRLANQALSLFIANFGHELRTPLNHIIGFSDLIENKLQNGVTQGLEKHAQTIRRSGASLLDTLDKIINAAEEGTSERKLVLEIFDADSLLRDAVAKFAPCAERNRNRVELHVDGALGLVQSDLARSRTAIEQIAENACKHCTDGLVVVRASRKGEGADASIEIEVSDSGPGIEPARAARLARGEFVPGDPLRDGGLGLGIPLAVRSLRAIGGSLGFTTVSEGGMRFVLSFPVRAPE